MDCRKLPHSFQDAVAGLLYVVRTQRNAQIHLTIALVVVLLGVWLRLPLLHWAVLVLTMGFVLVGEMLNTVAETLVDLVSPGYHPLAKIAKDIAAGAVLLTALVSVVVGFLILGPPLWQRLFVGS